MTDNDGDVAALEKKYAEYLAPNTKKNIRICFDGDVDEGNLEVGGRTYNYNTLEPKLLKANSLATLNDCFGTDFEEDDQLRVHMQANKTLCALRIFDFQESLQYPQYIRDAIEE